MQVGFRRRTPSMSAKPRNRQRGSALLAAMLTSLVLAGMILAATGEMSAMRRATEIEFQAEAQARSLAEAGLVDAYAWFRRQTVQPVAAFSPRLDLLADPPINETDDPDVGLIREFEITNGLWGQYVVRRGETAEPFSDADQDGVWDPGETFVDENGDGIWTPAEGTRDVTRERGLPGSGAVWLVRSRGTIFRRPRLDLPLGEGPNARLAAAEVATEVRRLTIAPPADAAVCAGRLDKVTVGNRGRIRGSATGVAAAASTGSLTIYSGGEVLTSTKSAGLPEYGTSYQGVFGVDLGQLKSMADISTSAGTDGLPLQIPDFSLVVVEGDVTFSSSHPLRGTGLLVVHGNLTVEGGSNSFFNGVLHVSGDVTIRAPAYLRGTIIAEGRVDLAGTGGDYVEIEHDPDIVSRLLTVMGQYRLSKANYLPGRVTADGRPRDALGRYAPEHITAVTGGGGGTETSHPALPTLDGLTTSLADLQAQYTGETGADVVSIAITLVEDAKAILQSEQPDLLAADAKLAEAQTRLEAAVAAGYISAADAETALQTLGDVVGTL